MKAKEKLDEILAVPENDFGKFTEEKKREIVQFHLDNTPFYKNLAGISTFEKWEDLPVMKKSDFQRPLNERLSKGYSQKMVYINKTSGSSGDPVVFAKNKEYQP